MEVRKIFSGFDNADTGIYDLYILLGDSLSRGNSESVGPTPTADTVFEWNGSAVVEVTTNDLAQAVTGSMWPQHGILRNTARDKKILYVNCAVGGSEIGPYGDPWSDTGVGTLWQNAVNKVAGALLIPGAVIKGVIISGGANDYRGVIKPTQAEFKTAYQSIIDRVNTEWGNPNIFLFQVGQTDSETSLSGDFRVVTRELVSENTKVNLALANLSYYAQGYMQVDRVHFTQAGNDKAGEQISRYESKSGGKRTKNLLSRFDTELSAAHQSAWETFLSSCESNGNLSAIEHLTMFVSTTDKNRKTELIGITIPQPDSAVHTPNSHVTTNGTSTYIGVGYVPSHDYIDTDQNDILQGVKVKQTTTTAGVTACIFGGQAAAQFYLLQSASGMQYRVFDSTTTTWAAKTKPSDDTFYAIGRNGGTKFLMEEDVEVSSASVASTSSIARPTAVGARGLNFGSYDLFCAGEWECYYVLKWSAVTSYSDFLTDLRSLITSLKT